MSDKLSAITIEIGELEGDVYPLRLYSQDDETEVLVAEEKIAKEEFDRTNQDKWLSDPIAKMLGRETETNEFVDIGMKLFSKIHLGEVGQKWDEFIEQVKDKKGCVRLRILANEVFAFPWELLCNDRYDRLASETGPTYYRTYKENNVELIEESSLLPLRVLIVIGSEPGDPKVLPEEELRKIKNKIRNYNREHKDNQLFHRLMDIEELANPTLDELKTKYQEFKPHIFHFIGHGIVDSGIASLIIRVKDEGTNEYIGIPWSPTVIKKNFKQNDGTDKWRPRLVIINACRTEVRDENDENLVRNFQKHSWSIGDIFRDLGIPAIISMQTDISGKGAGIFSGELYKQISNFEPLDVAVAKARDELMLEFSETHREWATPVLTLGLAPDKVLPLNLRIDKRTLDEIKSCDDLKGVELFSNRIKERRRLLGNMYSPGSEETKNLMIIRGGEGAGKSWMTKFCLEILSLLNVDVRYVPVKASKKFVNGQIKEDIVIKTWLDLLLQIRDGDKILTDDPAYVFKNTAVRKPLDEKAFYSFNWTLEKCAQGEKPGEWDGTETPPKKIRLKQERDTEEGDKWTVGYEEIVFNAFRKSLKQATRVDRPLIIVFDEFTEEGKFSFVEQMNDFIIPQLVRQVARGELDIENRSVRFVFVLREDEFENFNLDSLEGFNDFSLDYMSPSDLQTCIEEYARNLFPDIEKREKKEKEEFEGHINLLKNYALLKHSAGENIPASEVEAIAVAIKNKYK